MAKSKKLSKDDLYKQAIAIVQGEKVMWETATAFVTDRVAFRMRNLIRTLRKNYWGVFDSPIDPDTGKNKVWPPLTEVMVEQTLKEIDMDLKDTRFRATKADGVKFTSVVRHMTYDRLEQLGFGEKLDLLERQMAIDGTAVWKIWKEDGKPFIKMVDLLNCYIDPTVDSIQNAFRFTERGLMTKDEIASMSGWYNITDVETVENLARTDSENYRAVGDTSSEYVDVYEMWGKIPKSLITGDEKDNNEIIDGHIVVSGLETGDSRCHLIEKNNHKDKDGNAVKPYEEAWYTRVPGRWYGRGIAEKLLSVQLWLNIVINTRIKRNEVSQLGLFKIRRGQGITQQMLSRFKSNGAILVNSMDDLQQLVVQEAGQSSYTDERVIFEWAQRLTSNFQVVTGESMPSTTTATTAAIQDRNARSMFSLVKEGLGMFLQRVMNNHFLPIMASSVKVGDFIRLSPDLDDFEQIVDKLAVYKTDEFYLKNNLVPTQAEMISKYEEFKSEIAKNGDMFVKIAEKIMADAIEAKVYFTNEPLDIAVQVKNIVDLVPLLDESDKKAATNELFNLLNLEKPSAYDKYKGIEKEAEMGEMGGMGQFPRSSQPSPTSLQGIVTAANAAPSNVTI